MQKVRQVPGKRPSHLVRLQYFSTNKVHGETQLSLEDSVLRNASRSELGIQSTTMVLYNLNQCTRMKELRLSGMYQFMQRV